MNKFLILLRGINVGGKNKMPMATLQLFLEDLGCQHVRPYIQSGNVVVESTSSSKKLTQEIEAGLPKKFQLDSAVIKVLIVTPEQLSEVVENKPPHFGDNPDTYHSDVIFLIGIDASKVKDYFQPKEGVDSVWFGTNVVYSQRLSSKRTQSRLSRIVGTPVYASMTIRNWNTTLKLFEMIKDKPAQ